MIRVAVVGDPNVGKSTLINGVLGRRVSSACSTFFYCLVKDEGIFDYQRRYNCLASVYELQRLGWRVAAYTVINVLMEMFIV